MLVVGLTGGIGCGKSTVAEHFASLGIDVVDTDVLARQVVEPGQAALDAINEHFGDQVILNNGALDRRALREIIFAQPNEKLWLEQLIHPLVRRITLDKLSTASSAYVLLVSPLLMETDQIKLVDKVIVVDIDETEQLKRASCRDEQRPEAVQQIIKSQITRQDRLARADFIIDNSGKRQNTFAQVEKLHNMLLKG